MKFSHNKGDKMQAEVFSVKLLLETLFKVLKRSTNYFADAYLLKDVSLISKWKTGKAIPKNEDINKIVEFVNNEATGMQRHLIRRKIEEYINASLLDISLKNMLLDIEDFSLFLTETLIISVSYMNTTLDIKVSNNNFPSISEENEGNENLTQRQEEIITELTSNSHEIPKAVNSFSILYHKFRTKIILLLIVLLCITIFTVQQLVSNSDMNSKIYTSNYSIANELNTIKISDEYFVSYTHLKDSEKEVRVDINNIPIEFSNLQPKVIKKVLYLPFSDTLKRLGFSLINYSEKIRSYKDLRSGKTVIAKVGSKNLLIDNINIKLSDPIIMEEFDIYIPAYSLMGLIPYMDRMIPYSIDIKVDNKIQSKYQFEPRMVNGILYLPFRYIFELFDYDVKPDRRIQDGIDRAIAENDKQTVEVEESKEFVVLNGKPIPISAAVLMIGDTTYVPVDIIKQVLNMDYNWAADKKILEIAKASKIN